MIAANQTQRVRPKLWLTSLALVVGLVAVVGGCATGPGAKATNAAADVLLPPAQEEKLGRRSQAKVTQQFQVVQDSQIQQYVDQIGNKVVRAAGSKPKGIDYQFTVIRGDQVNAFTMPGGDIYVYTGLLGEADNEAELASVLAHEVAHVTQRHIAEKLVASYGLDVLSSAALGNNPGMLGQLAAGLASKGYLINYTRSQEKQADSKGLSYLVRAGYDPHAFVSFFEKLQKQGGARLPKFLSSHPSPKNRIQAAQARIRRMRNPPGNTGRSRYQQVMGRLNGR